MCAVVVVLACALVGGALGSRNASRVCRDPGDCGRAQVWNSYTHFTTNQSADGARYGDAVVSARIAEHAPVLDAAASRDAGDTCRRHMSLYLRDLRDLQLWALKLHDSSAKLPAGVLNGNVNQLGDFDQCLSVRHRADRELVQGRYCLTAVQLTLHPNASDNLRALHKHMHSNYAFRSELDDPGHRVPKFSSVRWGVCVPAGCSHAEVGAALRLRLSAALQGSGLEIGVRVRPQDCHVARDRPIDRGALLAGAVLLLIVTGVAAATVYDYRTQTDRNKLVLSFSLRHNVRKMTRTSADDIGCVHGVRFLNSLMLIISHKSMAVMFLPFHNRTDMSFEIGKPWTVMSRAASLYTDPFIMFSGLLTTYSILRRLNKHGHISLRREYISRLVRIMPSFVALIVFCTWLMPRMSSGPYWNEVVTSHADICKRYWWRNLLFIHNYFGFENMCLTHTHHIGIDTQLFVATPPLVLLLWRWPRRTAQALLLAAALSTAARYYVTYSMNLSNYVFFGTSVRQLFDTADYMYILPAHRLTVYVMGMLLACLLHYSKNIALSKTQLRMGWAVTTAMMLVSFLGPAGMGRLDYEYNATQAACYAAFAPIAWCAFFAWIIYTSQMGYESYISRAFSWKGYALWTKISYSVYLTQFPVFFYTVGTVRLSQRYDFLGLLLDSKEYTWILITSCLLTLLIEYPCQNLKDLVLTPATRQQSAPQPDGEPAPLHKRPDCDGAVRIVEKYRNIETDKTK